MAESNSSRSELGPELSLGQRVTRAAVGILFYLILLIPRIRRLRRRVALWNTIRFSMAGIGGLSIWAYIQGRGAGFAAAGCGLILLALLLRATPVVKSLEERARELGALAVLNGGSTVPLPGAGRIKVTIFAGTETLVIEDKRGRRLWEIPVSKLRTCRASALEPGEGKPWALEVEWEMPEENSAQFHFEGFFAEHLAGVAETTINNLRTKPLPILKS